MGDAIEVADLLAQHEDKHGPLWKYSAAVTKGGADDEVGAFVVVVYVVVVVVVVKCVSACVYVLISRELLFPAWCHTYAFVLCSLSCGLSW